MGRDDHFQLAHFDSDGKLLPSPSLSQPQKKQSRAPSAHDRPSAPVPSSSRFKEKKRKELSRVPNVKAGALSQSSFKPARPSNPKSTAMSSSQRSPGSASRAPPSSTQPLASTSSAMFDPFGDDDAEKRPAASTQPNPSRDGATASSSTSASAAAAAAAAAPVHSGLATTTTQTSGEEGVKYSFRVTVENLDLRKPDAAFEAALQTPFPGEWTVYGEATPEGGFVVGLQVDGAPHGCVGTDIKRSLLFRTLNRHDGDHQILIKTDAPVSTVFPNDAHKHYEARCSEEDVNRVKNRVPSSAPFHLVVFFEGKPPLVSPARTFAKRTAGLVDKPRPHNVCLVFPSSSPPLRLWTSKELLTRSTNHFDSQLVGSLTFTALDPPSKRRRLPLSDADDEDSDAETDNNLLIFRSTTPSTAPEPELLEGVEQIEVKDFSYSTYRAVITYLSTGHITFAPLASSFSPLFPGAQKTRIDYLEALDNASHDADDSSETVDLPHPVSPKSVYALASTLNLPDLQHLALAHLKDFLRVETAALELVSPLALSDDAVLDAVVDFVVEHLEEVEKTEAYRSVMDSVKAGEKPKAAGVVVKLWEKQRAKGTSGASPVAAKEDKGKSQIIDLFD